jgi:hypothetical protein
MKVVKGASGDVCGALSAFGEVFLSIATSCAVRSAAHMMSDFGQDFTTIDILATLGALPNVVGQLPVELAALIGTRPKSYPLGVQESYIWLTLYATLLDGFSDARIGQKGLRPIKTRYLKKQGDIVWVFDPAKKVLFGKSILLPDRKMRIVSFFPRFEVLDSAPNEHITCHRNLL